MKGVSTYLGAAPIVECLEKYQPNVVITSRIADAALFVAPMVWNFIISSPVIYDYFLLLYIIITIIFHAVGGINNMCLGHLSCIYCYQFCVLY